MTARDPIEFTGQWTRRGMIHVPIVDQPPASIEPQTRSQRARCQTVPGQRPTFRTEICECGCLLIVGETCPACGGRS